MTIQEQADSLLDQAQLALDQGTAAQQSALASTIRNFIGLHEIELANSGSQWRIDQLDGAVVQLTGGLQDHTASQASPFWSGVDAYAADKKKIDPQFLKEAAGAVAKTGKEMFDEFLKELTKSPAVVAVLVVGAVLAAAWAYRSFK
jgi:hypothetical protein